MMLIRAAKIINWIVAGLALLSFVLELVFGFVDRSDPVSRLTYAPWAAIGLAFLNSIIIGARGQKESGLGCLLMIAAPIPTLGLIACAIAFSHAPWLALILLAAATISAWIAFWSTPSKSNPELAP